MPSALRSGSALSKHVPLIMASEARLLGMIRLKLRTGLLPTTAAARLWAGYGADEVCSVCDEQITRNQKLHEWDHEDGKIIMHIECWELWNEERLRVRGPLHDGDSSR